MKRIAAVIAAIAMIAGAFLLRSRSDDSKEAASITVGCATVVATPCQRWAQQSGYGSMVLTDVPPPTGYAEDGPVGVGTVDIIVAPEPYAAVAFRSASTPTPVGASRVVIVVRTGDSTTVRDARTAWSDVIDAGSRLWVEPDSSWLAPPVRAGLVVSELDRAARENNEPALNPNTLARNDLENDVVRDAFSDLAAATSGNRTLSDTSDAVASMNARVIDAVGTVQAVAGSRSTQEAVPTEPAAWATIAVVSRDGLQTPTPVPVDTLRTALQRAGWVQPPAETTPIELLIGIAAELRS
jgi:hypothetical protein